jgi:filamentous hemagglutinin family protein
MKPRPPSPNLRAARKWLCVFLAVLATLRQHRLLANPTGMTVAAGHASAQQLGSLLNVTVGQAAVLNWQSFNIAPGETTSFLQPSANSVVLNVIGGASPAQIFGGLKANGTVILENASGFYFGPNSMVKVGGSFIATTAPITPDFGSGAAWQFTGTPPLASIVNYGQIEVGTGKSLFLIAENIENHGGLNAPQGNVDLVAGQSVLVSESPDGRGLSAKVTLPQGAVDNLGQITADGGSIVMEAKVVNQGGLLQADSIQNKNGVIELVASDQLNLGANSQILARGDDSRSGSAGGSVTLKSQNIFSDATGSEIDTTGGANGGNGGNIEISAPEVQSLNSRMDAGAQSGFAGGEFLLDPVNIILGTSTAGGAINVNTAFAGFSTILLQATGNVTLNASTTWNLSTSTGKKTGQLTLEAGGDIIFGNKSTITDANDWSVSLYAGYNNGAITSGSGNIYLNGGLNANNSLQSLKGSIQTAQGSIKLEAGEGIYFGTGSVASTGGGGIQATALDGDINLQAGFFQTTSGDIDLVARNNLLISTGYIVTTGGGNIFAQALLDDITTGTTTVGTDNSGYNFNNNTSSPSTVYGGIGTYGGGNVALIAGDSINPPTTSKAYGVAGAFGSKAGDVTLIAGNQVTGTFNVANGTGTILAGTQVTAAQAGQIQTSEAGSAGSAATLANLEASVMLAQNANANIGISTEAVTLGLSGGGAGASWNLWAANNLFVNEVRNPNGAISPGALATSGLFNYALNAAANFWAGDAITLGSLSQGLSGNGTADDDAIYCPSLSLTAGQGGITVNNSIYLYPSSQGSLKISSGGNLLMVGANLPSLTMSDSALTDYNDLTSNNGGSPIPALLHLGNSTPVTMDVSGNVYNFNLVVPTFANITVAGSTYNFGFSGQNLSTSLPASLTSIKVAGDISYSDTLHGASVSLSDPLPAAVLNSTDLSGDLGSSQLTDSSGQLAINGQMTIKALNYLLGSAAALDPAQQAAVLALYSESQPANQLTLAGFGDFDVKAHNIDLGISAGITAEYYNLPDAALTAISPYGANINVTTTGDLNMTTTAIANGGLLGGIDLSVGGALNVGGTATALGSASAPKGIFTSSGGNITVDAVGDVNVDGSRIAAFNGGNVDITSQTGDVNAGLGGQGSVVFTTLQLDPVTQQLILLQPTIPFSGILATTVFGSDAALGNITINAPEGSVNSSVGGVLQIAFNNADTAKNFIDVTAGKDIDATGSGVIGYNVKLQAAGNINGVVVGVQSVAVTSQQSVDVTAVSGGNVDINASGTVSGTVIGGGDVSVSGSSIDASVRGGTVSTAGDTSGATLGAPAAGAAQPIQVADSANTVAAKTDAEDTDDELKKKKGIALAQKVSRVTVLLPTKP